MEFEDRASEQLQATSVAMVGVWVALFALGLAALYQLVTRRRRPGLRLPPGPPGVPVLGNMAVFGSMPHHALAKLSGQYGPLMFLRLGSTPAIVASSPAVFQELFKNQDLAFASRPYNSAVELMLYRGKDMGFAPYGDYWRQLRKLATVELLTQKKIDQFESFRVAEASAMVRAVHQDALHGNGKAVNLRSTLKALTFNFITQICFSKRYFEYESHAPTPGRTRADGEPKEINPEDAREFTNVIEEMFTLLGVELIGDYIPYLSFLDWITGYKPRMRKCHNRFDEFLNRILAEHRKHPKQHANPDFVDVLLTLPGQDGSQHLDDVIIKALCMDMVSAGTDTSANAMEWTMSEIVRHPEIGAKLQAEMDSVVGKERLVTEADIPNLPYLQAVVKESFRFHPPGAFNIPHMSKQQTKVMGYDIPESTMVFANVWAMQRDPAVWDNPMEFCPQRFLDKPEIDVRGQNFELLPFGSGRRGCPGMNLGLTMVHYGLARLVQAFDWSPPKGMQPQDVDIEESFGLTLPRAHVLEALPTPRLSFLLY